MAALRRMAASTGTAGGRNGFTFGLLYAREVHIADESRRAAGKLSGGARMTKKVLHGKRVAILATNGVERRELDEPRDAVRDAGADTELLSLEAGDIDARNHDLEPAGEFTVDRAVAAAAVDEFDALLIPGGTVNADKLRLDESAVAFVRDFVQSGKPVGVICHGPWTLIEAGVVKGRTLTSFPSLRTDLRNAGANPVDEEVVVDGNLISSRSPDDLPAFCKTVVEEFARAR
jgi:protease I